MFANVLPHIINPQLRPQDRIRNMSVVFAAIYMTTQCF